LREGPLTIAQVNASEQGGGAERVARQLLDDFRRRGHNASLLVGPGEALGPYSLRFPADFRARLAHILAGPLRILDRQRGLETFHYPATHRMLDTLPGEVDIVHLHNLHGGYFDLRVLPELSRRHPVVLTLHDAWLLSGHCAHSMGCERWRTGCGSCPDLSIYPAIRRDATARNWHRKRDIFRRTRLHVAAPSAWLARNVERSILAPAVEDLRVIPNGVDLDTFRPGDSRAARSELRLPDTGFLLLFVGSNVEVNGFKDYPTVRNAAARVAEVLEQEVTLVVLGSAGTDAREGRARIQHIPFQSDPLRIALYYQACDLYLHAAHADTFPLTVLEALACGRPVVATAVGGIPEQVRCLAGGAEGGDWPSFDASDATGILVEPADPEALARAAERLLRDVPLRMKLGGNATRDAKLRFDARHQAGAYLEWYRTMEGPRSG
jgi:glycosyltransferase involved in cell wall biosynthesis